MLYWRGLRDWQARHVGDASAKSWGWERGARRTGTSTGAWLSRSGLLQAAYPRSCGTAGTSRLQSRADASTKQVVANRYESLKRAGCTVARAYDTRSVRRALVS